MLQFLPAIISGLGGLGGLFGNRDNTTKSTSNTQSNNQQAFNTTHANANTSTPMLNPQAQELLNPLVGNYMDMLGKDTDLSGYQAQGVSQINKSGDLNRQKIISDFAQRGITSGPGLQAALSNADSGRFSNAVNFKQQIPLLAQQLMMDKLKSAGNFFSQIPHGTYNESFGNDEGWSTGFNNSTSQSTQTNPGNQLGGLFGGLGSILANLFGQGAFGGSGGGSGQVIH